MISGSFCESEGSCIANKNLLRELRKIAAFEFEWILPTTIYSQLEFGEETMKKILQLNELALSP